MKQLIAFLKDLGFRKKENCENNLVTFLENSLDFVYDIIDETRIIVFISGSYIDISKPGKKFYYSMAYTSYCGIVLEDKDKIRFTTIDKLKDYILLGIARENFVTPEYIKEHSRFPTEWIIYKEYTSRC